MKQDILRENIRKKWLEDISSLTDTCTQEVRNNGKRNISLTVLGGCAMGFGAVLDNNLFFYGGMSTAAITFAAIGIQTHLTLRYYQRIAENLTESYNAEYLNSGNNRYESLFDSGDF